MAPLFNIGIVILCGYLGGFLAEKVRLPKIVGYILMGVLLDPQLLGILPENFLKNSLIANDFALAIITFSVGSSLAWSKIKQLGKSIVSITFFEAEFAFIFVAIGMTFMITSGSIWHSLAVALLLAALASPTDPTATLAVEHEYKADGPVSRTIMGVAASDDALGIMNFSLAVALASALLLGSSYLTVSNLVVAPLIIILTSLLLGIVVGAFLTFLAREVKEAGSILALVFGTLFVCYGAAHYLHLDELLSTMTVGIAFVNMSRRSDEVFALVSNYFEELIFIIFFVLAGANLNFSTLINNAWLIVVFVILRTSGKFLGTYLGARISGASLNVRRYTAYGLLPQGGIVIGLAILIQQNPNFHSFGSLIVSLILGTTVIHEFIGPLLAKFAIGKAGEIKGSGSH